MCRRAASPIWRTLAAAFSELSLQSGLRILNGSTNKDGWNEFCYRPSLRRGAKRNFRLHRGSAPRDAIELKRPAQLQHAFSHIDHARPPDFPVWLGSQFPGGKAFNPAAFTPPPKGQQGNFGRNVLRGFGAWRADVAFQRQFHLTEKVGLRRSSLSSEHLAAFLAFLRYV